MSIGNLPQKTWIFGQTGCFLLNFLVKRIKLHRFTADIVCCPDRLCCISWGHFSLLILSHYVNFVNIQAVFLSVLTTIVNVIQLFCSVFAPFLCKTTTHPDMWCIWYIIPLFKPPKSRNSHANYTQNLHGNCKFYTAAVYCKKTERHTGRSAQHIYEYITLKTFPLTSWWQSWG